MTSSFSSSVQFLRPNAVVYRANQKTSIHPRFVRLPVSATYASAAVAERASTSTSSLYDVLGIEKGATRQEIKSAYRRLARVLHPDVVASAEGDKTGHEFMRVHEAYHTLSDADRRDDYDRLLYAGRSTRRYRPMGGGGRTSDSGFSGYSRRSTWETDQCW